MDQSLGYGIGLTAVVLVALLSLPAIKQVLILIRRRLITEYEILLPNGLYEDEDGIATENSIKAYSDTRPRVATALAVPTGLALAVATRVLTWGNQRYGDDVTRILGETSSWSDVICWGFITLQVASLHGGNNYLPKFRLALGGLVSSLLLTVSIGLGEGFDAIAAIDRRDARAWVLGLLILLQFCAAICASAAFAAFPRRPDVYHKDLLVDRQRTVSLLEDISFSWIKVLYAIAKERTVQIKDVPTLDYKTRSKNLQERFLTERPEGRLWWQLIRVFRYELFVQWGLTLVIAVLALFPQVVLYNFLERIERRQDFTTADPTLFAWIFGLLLSQVLQVGFANRLKWITSSRLDLPVTSVVQALVFSKALKQHETAAPGQKDSKGRENTAEPNGKEKARANIKDKGTRQSVLNHMKLDSNRVSMFCVNNNNFPMALFKLILAGSFLMSLMGWKPVVAGLGCGALMIPLSTVISKNYGNVHFNLMRYRDSKAHLLTEALQGMRQIRYSALEKRWEDKILASREEELRQYWWLALWQAGVMFIINMGPLLLAMAAFLVYTWENGTHIKASVIFTSLGLFDQLDEAIALLPLLQMYMVEAYTSAVRLEKYFSQPDKEPVSCPGEAISFEKVTVAWPKVEDADKSESREESADAAEPEATSNHSLLRDVTLEFPAGELSVITGKTGSGKSLLLAAILGEVKLVSGTIQIPPQPDIEHTPPHIPDSEWIVPQFMSFVSQTPWIESGTVKENIVFGLPCNEPRYNKVLRACALEKDIELLIDGDETEVGPKGVTLSGGQRWRVALGRALYSRAGILILDDVLSAVDAHVGRLIVDEALTGELAQGRTRILATHHAEMVLPRSSLLIRLDDGKLKSIEKLSPEGETGMARLDGAEEAFDGSDASTRAQDDGEAREAGAQNGKAKRTKKSNEEEREKGRVKSKVYLEYFKASGGWLWWLAAVTMLVINQFMGVARTWSLKNLAQQAETDGPSSFTHMYVSSSQGYVRRAAEAWPPGTHRDFHTMDGAGSAQGVWYWLVVYVVLGFAMSAAQVVRVILFFYVGLRAARTLFQRMTHSILRAPLRWIDTVPAGRILNRFTSDTFTVDRRLANECLGIMRSFLVMGIIISTTLTVSGWIIAFALLLFVFYYRIASEYIHAARELKRINSISHSPVYDQFSSVLSGLSTIRAFGRTPFYMDRMYELIDNGSKASWSLAVSSRWMAFRMGMLGALFVAAVATAVALGGVDAALAGFSLTFALRYTSALTSVLQNMASVELGFNACERVLEYTEIETEPQGGLESPAGWPSKGEIEVDNLTVAYAPELPPVLKKMTFTIQPGERVGIVGRTGAGKSTLASVLFRLLEPREGAVRIDGLDIASLKLTSLRSRLAIIPQDPFLFSGTLRSNLDMEDKLSDEELHQALQRVHLVPHAESVTASASSREASPSIHEAPEPETEETVYAAEDDPEVNKDAGEAAANVDISLNVADAPTNNATNDATISPSQPDKINIFNDLSTPISTGGANLSQGQRQLVCLARALLVRPKIVVLDEATSAVDRGTDAAIQESLRQEFAANGCTVLVIAHRLSTVADFDRILVLEKGRVAEMGSPKELVEAGMRKEAEEGHGMVHAEPPANPANDEGEDDTMGESGSSTQVDGEGDGDGDDEEAEIDGTGIFWGLVKKSAEREKLVEMILH